MKESRKRINEYQALLPGLKAKVASVGLFLLMSVLMMTSASFAWVTLSKNPEVKGMATTITANGNLEVALSNNLGTVPNESQVGDANLGLALRNMTWGNLVNLSDASYGLESLVLRPASLNSSSLLTSPLFAAKYSDDGRIEDLISEFAYTNYSESQRKFIVPGVTQYGVRAISSVTYTYDSAELEANMETLQMAKSRLNLAKNQYALATSDSNNMSSISKIMGDYLTERFAKEGSAPVNYKNYIPQIYSMMTQIKECFENMGDAYVIIANLQSKLAKGPDATTYTLESLFAATSSQLTASGVSIEGLSLFKTNYNTYMTHYASMEALNTAVTQNGSAVYWEEHGLDVIVNFLVDVNSCQVDGMPVSSIGADEAAGLVMGGGDHVAVITKGCLYDMERLLGTYLYAEKMPVKVTYMITVTLTADVYTAAATASSTAIMQKDMDTTQNKVMGGMSGASVAVAAETYGMAIDFWVRTNQVSDFLTLEGHVIRTTVHKQDEQGNLYYGDQEDRIIIKSKEDGKFYTEDWEEVEITEDQLVPIMEEVVIGYEGENRVWDDENLTVNSSTQGSGSCYVFYADNPQDQAQSIALLEAMTIVFIDEEGNLLAYADMDTEAAYSDSGRVTVPMKLRNNSLVAGTDEEGNTVYAITELNNGEAKRITALIYLDGSKVENTEVLSDGNIQGKLNLQFGTIGEMNASHDEEIYSKEIHIKASADKTNFNAEETSDFTTNLSLNIEGLSPNKVEANFIRKISNSQGTRQETIRFTGTNGNYTATTTFVAPGTYVLRSVWLDGVEYMLESEVTITVTGFAISSVGWDYTGNYHKVMSAASSVSEDLTIVFAGTGYQPRKVQAVFGNEDNQQVVATFRKGTTNWMGTAKFSTSGKYTMKYLIVDGEYYEVPAAMQKTIELSLGMRAVVQISETSWEYKEPKTVAIYATIVDNKGTLLTTDEEVSIQYLLQGSSLVENGLYSELTWNPYEERYEGNFDVRNAGAYQFGYLSVGNSSINSATAPIITAIPPVPPAFYGNLTESSIFAYGADVSMKVALQDSVAIADGNIIATIQQVDDQGNVVKDGNGNPIIITVAGTKKTHTYGDEEDMTVSVNDWYFQIPSTDALNKPVENGGLYGFNGASQLATWQITKFSIIGAYANGEISTEENPYEVYASNLALKTTIDDEMNVKVSGTGENVGNDALFLDASLATDVNSIIVEIMGAGGESLDTSLVQNLQVTYQFDPDSATYTKNKTSAGYYYSSDTELASIKANLKTAGVITVTLKRNLSNTSQFILDADTGMSLPFAGTYKLLKVEFKIGNTVYEATTEANATGNNVKVPFNADSVYPTFSCGWQAPVVVFDSVSPSGNVTVDTGNKTQGTAKNVVTDKYNCTAHIQASFTKDSCGKTSLDGYTASKATTSISNVNNFTEASVFFDGSKADVTFTYTGSNKSNQQNIGVAEYDDGILGFIGGGWKKSILGNNCKCSYVTISGIVNNVTVTYVFQLANQLTINNPY